MPDRIKLLCDVCDYEGVIYVAANEDVPLRNCPRCYPEPTGRYRTLRVLTREPHNPDVFADEGEHNRADAPPSAIEAALARLAPNVRHALARQASAHWGCPACGKRWPHLAANVVRPVCPGPCGVPLVKLSTKPPAKADCAPAMPLELAAVDALEEAEDALLDVARGTASYHDLAVTLASIAALLRGGLGDDHDDAA